jgi:protein SCO1/2
VPLEAVFHDHTGAEVRLGDLLSERPAILALVYYDCPMLCSLVLQGLTRNLRALTLDVGTEFDVIAVSFDPSEGPAEAAGNRREVAAAYGRDAQGRGWHFLTGSAEAVEQITSAVGFRYRYDEESGEYAHAAGIVILTPDGRAARYLYGVDFPARDLRLALVEAGEGKVGSVLDQALLYCYRYDPKAGKYSAATLNIVRLGGVVTVLALAIFLTVSWRREARAGV